MSEGNAITLNEIVERCSGLNIDTKRELTDEYGELVFSSEDIKQWSEILAGILGPAVKPEGVKPAKEDKKITDDYGGIRRDQTLFRKEFNGVVIIAMFWPWDDGQSVTLKLACLQKKI
jgi:hypothetical protein